MCLRLKYAEAVMWKNKAAELISRAKNKSATIACDPLFNTNPRLSSLVSEIDSIKKRHGLLIEEALIFAINKLSHWKAMKEKVSVAGGNAHLDCLALNAKTSQLYVFECKRGHGTFDSDKVRAIDLRLDKVRDSIGTHVSLKGWKPRSTDVFIMSFYGATWKSRYPIYDSGNISSLFEPCVGCFVTEYMRHVETATANAYNAELRDSYSSSTAESIFDLIGQDYAASNFDVLFDEHGSKFISSDQPS